MANGFDIRALEIHGGKMWEEAGVLKALDVIQRYRMNALVFHGTDIVHTITFPRKYFGQHATWADAPPRRGENAILNNRNYLTNISRLCGQAGVAFYLEVKELAFPDEIFEVYPDLIVDGTVCPSDPRWADFLEVKYDELFADFPDIAGVIVSVGSPEGRAAMAARKCKCERCRETSLPEWYRDVTRPLADMAQKYGRELVVREFSYNPSEQQAVLDGLQPLGSEVDLMVKVYPHDFYPTFPDNAALDALPERRKWIEYDVHGQYYGWGVFPCPVAEDIHRRFSVAREKGVRCVIVRTDWERVNDLNCMDTFNMVNLAVAGMLAEDPQRDAREALQQVLLREGFIAPATYTPERLQEIAGSLLRLWPIFSKSLYVRGFVLNSSSMYPNGVDHAWWTMLTKHSLDVWQPGARELLDFTKNERVEEALAEKDDALAEVQELVEHLGQHLGDSLRLPTVDRVENILPILERYIQGFSLCGKVVILARAVREGAEGRKSSYLDQLERVLDDLGSYQEWLTSWSNETIYGHHVYMLMDKERVSSVIEDARGIVRAERPLESRRA
jgi:hypothetical protein